MIEQEGRPHELPVEPSTSKHIPYPQPLAGYEEVVAKPVLFMFTAEKLHRAMGTKFKVPKIGGRELDLHRLFVEVTSRGGIEKVLEERRWKEVTAAFNFPSTATNASFVLRKYYMSLLRHYEQLYYFKARDWIPPSTGDLQAPCIKPERPLQSKYPSPEILSPAIKLQTGIIDGKFDGGYLVTVTLGSEKLEGVLYQVPSSASGQMLGTNGDNNAPAPPGTMHPHHRKKCEVRRRDRDPAHPKPNRSGYNFFFAEQYARLKLVHSGKDRQISRMIGELWSNQNESQKAVQGFFPFSLGISKPFCLILTNPHFVELQVYQEKALEDKERYRTEMEGYRGRLRSGLVNMAPLLQQDVDMEGTIGEDSPHSLENASTSAKSDTEVDSELDKDLEMEESPGVGISMDDYDNRSLEGSVVPEGFELTKRAVKVEESEGSLGKELAAACAEPKPSKELAAACAGPQPSKGQ